MNPPPPGRQCGPGWEWEEKSSGARMWRELCWGSGAKPWLRRSLLVTHPRDTRGGEAVDDRARATAPGVQFMVPGGEKKQPVWEQSGVREERAWGQAAARFLSLGARYSSVDFARRSPARTTATSAAWWMQRGTGQGTGWETFSSPAAHHGFQHSLGSGDVTPPSIGTSGSLMLFDIRHLRAPVLAASRLRGHVERQNGHGLAPSAAPAQRGRQ